MSFSRDIQERFTRIERILDSLKTNERGGVTGGAVPAPVAQGDMLLASAAPAWDILTLGAQYTHPQAGAATATWEPSLTLADDTYIGLPGPGGRLGFDLTPTPDQLKVTDADLNFVTTAHGIIHVDGVVAGMVLRADGTRFVPAAAAATLPIAPLAVGDTLIATAGPLWDILTTPGAAGWARVSTATTEVWSQTPTMTGDWTWTSPVSAKPVLTLENTNADAQAPTIDFYKNSASPADNDDLGAIDFFGETSTGAKERYAYILAESLYVTNADTGGGLQFKVVMDAAERSLLELSGYNGVVNQGEVIVNQDGQDVDFRVEAAGLANALVVQGSDGQITLGVLGVGFVQSDAGGVLSSAPLTVGDISDLAYAAPSLTFTTANAAGAADTVMRTDASLAIFDATNPTSIDAGDAAAVGAAAFAARRDHQHAVNSSSNPGAIVSLLASDASGRLELEGLGLGVAATAAFKLYSQWASGFCIVGSGTTNNTGVFGESSSGNGVVASSGSGTGLIVDLAGTGASIAEFQDNGTPVLTIQDGGFADFAEYLRHLGDTDTYRRFQTNQFSDVAGGTTFLDAASATGALTLGGSGVIVPDNYTIGLALAAAGRIEFDNQATDEINFLDCNVGIGTSTPGAQLEVANPAANATAEIRITNDAQSFDLQVVGPRGDNFEIVNGATIPFAIEPATPTNTLYLDSTGNVGLGTAAPGSLLELNLATADLEIVDAGSAAATEQDWIEVEIGGVTGYIRVFAAK